MARILDPSAAAGKLELKKVLLIDLGGVLADLGDPASSMRLPMSSRDFWTLWTASASVMDYESGKIDLERFAERMAGELCVRDARDFLRRFYCWRLSVFPGIGEVLESAEKIFRLALLSNTNPVHWEQLRSSEPNFASFEKLFLSFETGRLKPRPAAFTQVLEHFGCEPEQLYFLDDSPANVESARRLGIRSEQVAGPAQFGHTLSLLQREAASG